MHWAHEENAVPCRHQDVPHLHELLREKTRAGHERLEELPFFRALDDGSLPALAVVTWLRSLALVHAVLARALAACGDPAVAALAPWAADKLPLLVADLAAHGNETVPTIGPAIEQALACGSEIVARDDQPLALVGALYVLEGSQKGGAVLAGAYARCVGAPLAYFGCHGTDTARVWREFAATLDALAIDAAGAERAATAAVRCFEAIERICAALHPFDEASLVHHIAAINFEAGDHAMPQDPQEIALALRAGHAAWIAFPYLEQRFGERGKRFTRSDSCWLVALASMPASSATKSLRWLRAVLAPRGLPTVILESHLRAIAGELAQRSAAYQPFLDALEAERVALPGWAAAIAPTEAALASCPGCAVPSAAHLVASAWLDERAGITGALAVTRSWFVDPARFSGPWIAAIDGLVARLDELGRAC